MNQVIFSPILGREEVLVCGCWVPVGADLLLSDHVLLSWQSVIGWSLIAVKVS